MQLDQALRDAITMIEMHGDGCSACDRALERIKAALSASGSPGADVGQNSSDGACVCQDQHRRGYCTEPGCPYATVPSSPAAPQGQEAVSEAKLLIDERLKDLAGSNAIYAKDQRLSAPDNIARNNREISWLKDLRSTLSFSRTLAPDATEAVPKWRERWYGSDPSRGWSIIQGRELIAHIGGDEAMSDAISKIVAAHNAAPPAKPSVEDIARVIRRAMLDNPTDVNFTVRAERRERLADDYAREIHALIHGAGGMEDRS